MQAFLRWHPNISLHTAEGITSASSLISEVNFKKWFEDVKTYLEEKGLDDIPKVLHAFSMEMRHASFLDRKIKRS